MAGGPGAAAGTPGTPGTLRNASRFPRGRSDSPAPRPVWVFPFRVLIGSPGRATEPSDSPIGWWKEALPRELPVGPCQPCGLRRRGCRGGAARWSQPERRSGELRVEGGLLQIASVSLVLQFSKLLEAWEGRLLLLGNHGPFAGI